MANVLTGQVAVISDMRGGWEELAGESCSVLIGKLVRKNGMECYHTDAPLLVRWPALATRHGTSWWWNADDLSAQTIRAFGRTSDLPAGSSFIFPPRSRWATPPSYHRAPCYVGATDERFHLSSVGLRGRRHCGLCAAGQRRGYHSKLLSSNVSAVKAAWAERERSPPAASQRGIARFCDAWDENSKQASRSHCKNAQGRFGTCGACIGVVRAVCLVRIAKH